MSARVEFVLTCDGCPNRIVSEHSLQDARELAWKAWWSIYERDVCYCPDCHRPLPGMLKAATMDWPDIGYTVPAPPYDHPSPYTELTTTAGTDGWPDLESLA